MEELNGEIMDSVPERASDDSHDSDARIGAAVLKAEARDSVGAENDTKRKADSFLRRHGRELAVFSRDSRLTFAPSTSAQTFAFYPKEFKVEAPLSWFASEKYNEDELSFANHHEIAHFIDMRRNPKAYLENFEHMKQVAERLAKGYSARHPGGASEAAVRKFYYGEIHGLYNVLDDICVNNLVFQRNKFFESGDGRKSIGSLYEKLGFEKADLTDQPLHSQMIMSLLRDEMLGKTHGKSIVDERVSLVLEKKKLGKNIREIIDMDLKPRQGILADPEERYRIIRNLIEPEYLKLLEVALEEQEEKNKQNQEDEGDNDTDKGSGRNSEGNQSEEGGDGQGGEDGQGGSSERSEAEDGGGGFNPFGDKRKNSSDILDHGENGDQVIEDILKSLEEADKIDKMSPEEREKYQAEKRTQEFDKKHGITKEQRAENEKVKARIDKARKKMRKFWHGLIGKSIEYRQTVIHDQRKGRLNVGSFIKKYPEIIESEQNGNLRTLEIYDRKGLERRIVDQPERIDISLLVDCSGSMDDAKVKAARQAMALLMYSIKDFNGELERTRRETHSKLRANTEVIVFGSDFERVKPFEREGSYDDNDAEIIRSVSRIDGNRGGTDDASPLKTILAGLTSEQKSRIREGKLKKIVFEITDGEPNEPSLTAENLAKLAEEGVIVIGFQIGEVEKRAQDTFYEIWNNSHRSGNKKGIFIGSEIDELPDRLMSELGRLLSNIRI